MFTLRKAAVLLVAIVAVLGLSQSGPAAAAATWTVLSASTGPNTTCAVADGGGVKCWGDNASYQVGDGTTTNRTTPVDVTNVSNAIAVGSGGRLGCALISDGSVKCWGNVAGAGTTATAVAGLPAAATDIQVGAAFACALLNTGNVYCWGVNSAGQVGNGTVSESVSTAVQVSGLNGTAVKLSLGNAHACVVTTSGGVKCWGSNSSGQNGDNTITNRSTPVDVSGLTSGASSVHLGTSHSCAVLTTGAVKCWGLNTSSQLGDGTTTNRRTPVSVLNLGGSALQVAAGGSHTCFLLDGNVVKCVGANTSGQLGNGTTTNSTTPVTTTGLTAQVTAIDAGASHTCATLGGGGLHCYGFNQSGQIGNNSTQRVTAPAAVSGTLLQQTITFSAPASVTYSNGGTFAVSASASSNLPVAVSSGTQDKCTVSGTTVSVLAAGTCTVEGVQPGDSTYLPTATITKNVTIDKASQTITFTAPASATYSVGGTFDVSASSTSGLSVGIVSTTTGVCTISGTTVSIVTGGNCYLTASQPGDGNFFASTSVTKTVTINKASQTISYSPVTSKRYDEVSTTFTKSSTSGLTVSAVSATSSICTLSGLTINFVGVGTCNITLSQAGDVNYLAATNVTLSFVIGKGNQTITFGALANKTQPIGVATTFTVSATSSSGLAVTFTASPSTNCSVSGNTVTLKKKMQAGTTTCTITAVQVGNTLWNAAPSVSRSFTITVQ